MKRIKGGKSVPAAGAGARTVKFGDDNIETPTPAYQRSREEREAASKRPSGVCVCARARACVRACVRVFVCDYSQEPERRMHIFLKVC